MKVSESVMFTLVWENSIAQLYVHSQPVIDSEPAVLVCFGNTCDFHSGMQSWRDSPGWAANAVLCVKDRTMDQATYRLAASDHSDSGCRDWTDSDTEYSSSVSDGVVQHLLHSCPSRYWVLAGLSGGCVTTAVLSRQMQSLGLVVLGLVADSGVPGSGVVDDSLPVAVYRFADPCEYWNGGEVAVEWTRRGYDVVFDEPYNEPKDLEGYPVPGSCHASYLERNELRKCVRWFWWNSHMWGK